MSTTKSKSELKSKEKLSVRATADAVVLAGDGDEMSLLVVRRRYPPFAGEWALPGGFIEEGESPLSAAIRELQEETGVCASLVPSISSVSAIPLRSRGRVGRDPRGWTTSSPFLFYVAERSPLQVSDESTEVAWVNLSELKRLAFDHGAILCEALSLYWEQFTLQSPLILKGKKGFKVPQNQRSLALSLSKMTFFCGTFLPWHQGHRACLELYLNSEKVSEEEILVIPDKNPFKNVSSSSSSPSTFLTLPFCAWEYYRDLQQKLEGLSCWVYPGFCGLEFANPTYYWLRLLDVNTTISSSPSFSLLMGDDSFVSLPTWIESEKLIKLIKHLWVVPRTENKNAIEGSEKWVLEQNSKTVIHYLPGHPYQDFSSTKLREN